MSSIDPKRLFPMVVKQLLNTNDTSSLYFAIETNDSNAEVTIDILAEDYNLSSARRVTQDMYLHNKETFYIPDTIDAYLHAVYHGAFKSAKALLKHGMKHDSVSVVHVESSFNPRMMLDSTGSSLILDGANDVCLAVLSNDKNALKNLVTMYNELGLPLDVNRKTAVPASLHPYRDQEAKSLKPLDIALMRYTAEVIKTQRLEKQYAPLRKKRAASEQLTKRIAQQLSSKTGGMGLSVMSFSAPSVPKIKPYAKDTMKNIELLMELGATGSDCAFFPIEEESARSPFNRQRGFEKTDYKTFCYRNSDIFSSLFRQRLSGAPDINALLQSKPK